MGWWSDLWTKKAQGWIYGQLPKENAPLDIDIETIAANEEYLHIYLRSMWIVDVGKGFSTFYAAVHSFITVAHRSGTDAQFNVLSSPNNLKELDPKHLENVITGSIPLLGPIPYRGGKVGLEVGLFSIKSRDLAQPYLSLMTEMSGLAGISFISAAMPFINPIKNGIAMLTNSADDTALEIGLSENYQTVQTGYYIVIRAPRTQFKKEDFTVDSDYKLIYKKDSKPVKEFPYMVFQIFTTKSRDDYFKIPEIQKAYKKLQDNIPDQNYDNINDALEALRIQLLFSNDLIQADGKKIYESIQKEVQELAPSTNTSAKGLTAVRPKLKNLQDFKIFPPEKRPA